MNKDENPVCLLDIGNESLYLDTNLQALSSVLTNSRADCKRRGEYGELFVRMVK